MQHETNENWDSHASIDIKYNITIKPQTQTVCYLYFFESIIF